MEAEKALYEIAGYQGGYFTAAQALAAGYSYPNQHYHTRVGNWVKEARGIYRFPYWPLPDRPDLILLTLMSIDRSGEPQAVVSHESALDVYGLSDANPDRIHLTVPPEFRVRMPEAVVIYRQQLNKGDYQEHQGFFVTSPIRTILDTAEDPASWPFLQDAIYDALEKGLVSHSQLRELEVSDYAKPLLLEAVSSAEKRLNDRMALR